MSIQDLDLATLVREARDEVLAPDDDRPSPHLAELHRRGTREIFDRAGALCAAADADDRRTGLRILRELGGSPPRFAADAVPLILRLLAAEPEPRVVASAVVALAWQHASGGDRTPLAPSRTVLDAVLRLAKHGDARVRFAVAHSIHFVIDREEPPPEAIRTLLDLSADVDRDNRHFAIFALVDDLGLEERDDVRDALRRLRVDTDNDIRGYVRRILGA